MAEDKNLSLLVLGMIGVIAVIGIVLMFSGGKQATGAVFTNEGVTADAPCDSPCTLFPSGREYDRQMQEDRINELNRNWRFSHYVTFTYIMGGRKEVLGCWCPIQVTPFAPTEEFAQIIPGTSRGASEYAGRAPGVPVDQYSEEAYPLPEREYAVSAPGPMPEYPLGTHTY